MGNVSETKGCFEGQRSGGVVEGALIFDDLGALITLRYRPLYSAQ
jgi:hypothetical protein